jgi:hypothetical protein
MRPIQLPGRGQSPYYFHVQPRQALSVRRLHQHRKMALVLRSRQRSHKATPSDATPIAAFSSAKELSPIVTLSNRPKDHDRTLARVIPLTLRCGDFTSGERPSVPCTPSRTKNTGRNDSDLNRNGRRQERNRDEERGAVYNVAYYKPMSKRSSRILRSASYLLSSYAAALG